MEDITFTSIARRAARYPVILRKGQMPPLGRVPVSPPLHTRSETGQWLLLNTLAANQLLQHAARKKTGESPG